MRLSMLERLDLLESKTSAGRPFAASVGTGGSALLGAGGGAPSAMAMDLWRRIEGFATIWTRLWTYMGWLS